MVFLSTLYSETCFLVKYQSTQDDRKYNYVFCKKKE